MNQESKIKYYFFFTFKKPNVIIIIWSYLLTPELTNIVTTQQYEQHNHVPKKIWGVFSPRGASSDTMTFDVCSRYAKVILIETIYF